MVKLFDTSICVLVANPSFVFPAIDCHFVFAAQEMSAKADRSDLDDMMMDTPDEVHVKPNGGQTDLDLMMSESAAMADEQTSDKELSKLHIDCLRRARQLLSRARTFWR